MRTGTYIYLCCLLQSLLYSQSAEQAAGSRFIGSTMISAAFIGIALSLLTSPATSKLMLERIDQLESNIISPQQAVRPSPQRLGSTRANNWVKISGAPSKVINTRLGERVEIECEAIGSPTPAIQWLRADRPIAQQKSKQQAVHEHPMAMTAGLAKLKSRLILDCVTRKDEGFYTCAAASGDATVKANPTLVLIEGIGHGDLDMCSDSEQFSPRITEWTPTAMETMGVDLLLPCSVYGSPTPTIYWVDSHGNILTTAQHGVSKNGELIISRLTWGDMGEYTCVAENSEGRDTATTFVYPVLEEPRDSRKKK